MKGLARLFSVMLVISLLSGCPFLLETPEPDPPEITDIVFSYNGYQPGPPVDPVIDVMASAPWGGWDDTEVLFIWVNVENAIYGTEYQIAAAFSPVLADPSSAGYLTPVDRHAGRMPAFSWSGWGSSQLLFCDAYGPGHWLVTAWLDGDASINYEKQLFITPYQPPPWPSIIRPFCQDSIGRRPAPHIGPSARSPEGDIIPS